MTKKELIELLNDYPDDMEVFTCGESVGGNFFDCTAWTPHIKTKMVVTEDYGSCTEDYVALRPCKETKGARKCIIIT